MLNNFITVAEASKLANCSNQAIYNLISKGDVESNQVGGQYLIEKNSLLKAVTQKRSRTQRKGGVDWNKLSDYLKNSGKDTVTLSIPFIQELTGTSSKMNFPVDFSRDMAQGKYGVRAYTAISKAGYDIKEIKFVYEPSLGCNIIKEVIVEKLPNNNQSKENNG